MKPAHAKIGGTSQHEREGSGHVSATRERVGSEGTPRGGSTADAKRRSPRGESERPSEEPRTGVVRKVKLAASRPAPSTAAPRRAAPKTAPPTAHSKSDEDTGAWRCLEWGERPSQRPPKRHASVSVAQLSTSGQLIRQDGPDAWLPEAGDFVHRMALLVAQGLGFDRCRAVCLRGPNAVLSVSEAGATKVVAVTGPVPPMANVLRRAGLE